LFVEIKRGGGMGTQNGGGGQRTDFTFEAEFEGEGFAGFGNDGDDFFGFQDLTDGHGDGLAGNFGDI